jgi:hypothetical protein
VVLAVRAVMVELVARVVLETVVQVRLVVRAVSVVWVVL